MDVLAVVGDARVVALGEGTHFVQEYWTTRHSLIRMLCEEAGFTLVAMEFGVGEALTLMPWLRGEAPVAELAAISPGAVQWGAADTMHLLRELNATRRLGFAGIDLPSAGGSFRPVLDPLGDYLAAVDPALGLDRIRTVTDRVDAGSALAASSAWSELSTAERDSAVSGLARVVLRMRALQPRHQGLSAPCGHRTGLLLAEAALATAYTLQAERELDSSIRERFMADAVLALLKDDPASRIVLMAHNNHIQKTPVAFSGTTYTLPMGHYLAQQLGTKYRVIGQTSTDGHVPDMVLDPDSPVGFRVEDRDLPAPPDGSLESALIALGADGRAALFDLRDRPESLASSSIRSQAGYVETDVSAAFDAVINHPRITRAAVGFE